MINEKHTLTITTEEGKTLLVDILFTFTLPDFKKHYIVYTLPNSKEEVSVLISEIDFLTSQVKKIPEQEYSMVIEAYQQIKKELIEN